MVQRNVISGTKKYFNEGEFKKLWGGRRSKKEQSLVASSYMEKQQDIVVPVIDFKVHTS